MKRPVDNTPSERSVYYAPENREGQYTIVSLGEVVNAVTAIGQPIFNQMQQTESVNKANKNGMDSS